MISDGFFLSTRSLHQQEPWIKTADAFLFSHCKARTSMLRPCLSHIPPLPSLYTGYADAGFYTFQG